MDRYVCVHGHFYQPPRENPWLEQVERQDSAAPFHDWNARITEECYRPNTVARMLDADGRLERLTNNYSRISFNVGPTLLAWLEEHDPRTYERILAADRESIDRFDGHGSAMAQVYNHAILPLANDRDRTTQVRWGVADFRHRFGREPEGMWLAETAADTATLEALAAEGIRFTVLSPYQAARTRLAAGGWVDATDGRVDTTRPYTVRLPSGASIAVFFYDGPLSRAVAFEGLLDSGDRFAERILRAAADRDGPHLVHLATDGESYGHHHRHGEMALAAALRIIERRDDVVLTNYAAYLERFPPDAEARIVEGSSWSCAHGVERWRSACGCGAAPGGSLDWRGPLRDALDHLRDELAPRFERAAGRILRDPWAARDDYVEVVLDRSPAVVDAFLDRHATGDAARVDRGAVLRLMELQRHALLMYTSCGWFFDDLARIETVQILRYAARAVDLAEEVFGDVGLRERFVAELAKAHSNDPDVGDGRALYEQRVERVRADLGTIATHVALTTLFAAPEGDRVGSFAYEREVTGTWHAGRVRLAVGRADIRSVTTGARRAVEFAVLHLGDHNVTCGTRTRGDDAVHEALVDDLGEVFGRADVPATIRLIDARFDAPTASLADLLVDERRRILGGIVDGSVRDVEATFRTVHRRYEPLLRFLDTAGVPAPAALQRAAEVVLNADLREAFDVPVDPARVRALVHEAARLGVELDVDGISRALDVTLRIAAVRAADDLADPARLARFGAAEGRDVRRVHALLDAIAGLPFEVDLGGAQEICYRVLKRHRGNLAVRAADGDEAAAAWLDAVVGIADRLRVRVAP